MKNTVDGLVAADIVVRFGGLVALDGAGVEARRGRITGLIGPNGAGKTTLFNVCCGFQRAHSGTINFDGVDLAHLSPPARARLGVGRTFQRMELFGSLTVRENVELAAEAVHIGSDPLTQLGVVKGGKALRDEVREEAAALIDEVGLGGVAEKLAGEVSTGHGRLVELARALARRPTVLLLDEPSSGLDAAESRGFGGLLERLVEERMLGILLVEHDMSLVLEICDWIHVLDFGRPLLSGTPAEVRASDDVRAAYLGREGAA